MTCKTLHDLTPAFMSSLLSQTLSSSWGRDPAAPGSSILFFKNCSPFLPLNLHTCSLCLDCHLRALPMIGSFSPQLRPPPQGGPLRPPCLKGPPVPLTIHYLFPLELQSQSEMTLFIVFFFLPTSPPVSHQNISFQVLGPCLVP